MFIMNTGIVVRHLIDKWFDEEIRQRKYIKHGVPLHPRWLLLGIYVSSFSFQYIIIVFTIWIFQRQTAYVNKYAFE